ncbi:protein-disulfide reductase DsbD N-terminal domain-containing protein [Niabella pedocola]|uniref:Protein-disulfide reductase DsbD N-terminal domain-containing protein n=1 Tax=Niabella pedocola TaxID=1752077 RepID=A0ABS8PY44_9BACT|nr:protein-disulfide reductase DsbD domain-containing protein [Niabella pedocola]MCD2426000.1 protein-disulfide reductase DsbD N-terminal domain-containing protein [Niabella pedocola]
MKSIVLALVAVLSLATARAQVDPASWKFTAKKISDKVYEVQMVATLKSGWHLYSQTQPKNAIAYPTKVGFTNNPLIMRAGNVKEVGKMEKFHDASTNSTAYQYANTVTFVQKVTLKTAAKTALSGTVEYQTCDDKQCLPPKKVPFNVPLG